MRTNGSRGLAQFFFKKPINIFRSPSKSQEVPKQGKQITKSQYHHQILIQNKS